MSKKVIIDGSQQKEIRLVVSDNGEMTDISLQGISSNQTRGNVYLAKVSRVEPSLQAVFIDYGDKDGKNGFLPFVEIHPSNFQIPPQEKEELLERLQNYDNKSAEGADSEDEKKNRQRYYDILSKYMVQEVIKKDQVILVQVTKERRGNKGAAFTTYLSIPGRFCVFMPNSLNQGGVSKKILESAERDRLKSLLTEFHDKHENKASVVIRTAGEYKTKAEIRRDFDYTVKIWDNIKKHTMSASAPSFIYKEADIVKQAIRDLYQSEIEEIVVSGKVAYQDTLEFMEMILPRHVDKVKLYKEPVPIFVKYGVEEQINDLYETDVNLKSGGHIVIQSTEALISVDVNSGKYTDERNVENTALRTNLEAAKEVARQIILRSLSGLVVIDFIDMKSDDNKAKVEKELRKAFADDRAKVVLGKIGKFGLLELSRQRIKQPFYEANTVPCERCGGKGVVRKPELTYASIIRNLDYFLSMQDSAKVKLIALPETILHLMQNCKAELAELEERYNTIILFEYDYSTNAEVFYIEQVEAQDRNKSRQNVALADADNAHYGKEPADSEDSQASKDDKDAKDSKTHTKGDRKKGKAASNKADESDNSRESDSQEPDIGNKQDKPKVRGANSYKNGNKSGRRKIARGKKVDKSEKIPNTDAESNAESAEGVQNQSLLKDIWRKIID